MTSISTIGPVMPFLGGTGFGAPDANKYSQPTAGAASNVGGPAPQAHGLDANTSALAKEFGQILSQLIQLSHLMQAGTKPSGMPAASAAASAKPSASAAPAAPPSGTPQSGTPQFGTSQAGTSQAGTPAQAGAGPATGSSPAASSASAGTGPNTINVTNNEDHAITVGKFKNGESTTDPSAKITLQPHQSGTLKYENGEGGYAAQADASGKFQPTASRMEYEADKDGKMKYPDVSYIDGRNASIALTDGVGLNKGDNKSIAGSAKPDIVTTDSANNKTITGWYDGSTGQMQAGGAFMQSQLGTSGSYLHPNDDKLSKDQNPMSGTQSSTINASFGNA